MFSDLGTLAAWEKAFSPWLPGIDPSKLLGYKMTLPLLTFSMLFPFAHFISS